MYVGIFYDIITSDKISKINKLIDHVKLVSLYQINFL